MILDIKLTCPKCGRESPFKIFEVSEEVLAVARLAAKFGGRWPWVEEYLRCFRSAEDKPLKPARMKLYLEELLRYVDQKGFNVEKQWHAVRPDALFAAIQHVAQAGKISFKNHNYLKRVAVDFNLKMIQREEKDQVKKEHELRERFERDPQGPEKIKKIMEGL